MKRALSAASLAALLLAGHARAEDIVSIQGSYWKERSTRVIAPMVRISADMPGDWTVDGTYIIDQITSASAAFTPTDEPFSEARNEGRLAVSKELWDLFTPAASIRISYEPDYTSIGGGLDLSFAFNQDNTTLSLFFQHNYDEIRDRTSPGFMDTLRTTLFGVGGSQVLAKDLVFGGSAEVQVLSGYQENVYRAETHPRERTRFALAAWGRYYLSPTDTAIRLWYRFYLDDWELIGNSFEVELTQTVIARHLEIAPLFRFHTQTGVFFTDFNQGYSTLDPKLTAFAARTYGVSLRWQLTVLEGGFLDVASRVSVVPSYRYLDQDNVYGPAHIAQLGLSWPF